MKNLLIVCLLVSAVTSLHARTPGELAQVLQSDASLQDKFEACRELAIVGDEASVPVLAGLLKHPELSHMARYALEPMPFPAVDAALREALDTARGRARIGHIHSVGVRNDPQAVPRLARLAMDESNETAQAARRSLARIANPEAIKALRKTGDIPAQLAASRVLLDRGDTPAAARLLRALESLSTGEAMRIGILLGLLEADPENAFRRVVQVSGEEPESVRLAVLEQVLTDRTVGKRLEEGFGQASSALQVSLLHAWARTGDVTYAPTCLRALQSTNEAVRIAAIGALAGIPYCDAAPDLCRVLAGPASEEEQQAAIRALTGLPGPSVGAAIMAFLRTAPAEIQVRCMGMLADRRAVAEVGGLLELAGAGEQAARLAAVKALAQLAEPGDLPGLGQVLQSTQDPALQKALERTLIAVARKTDDVNKLDTDFLDALSTSPNPALRHARLRILGGLATGQALDTLSPLLGSTDPAVADIALRALVDWPDARAVDPLLAHLSALENSTSRILVVKGCARMLATGGLPEDQTLAAYRTLLNAAVRPEEKKRLLAGLAGMSSREAADLITPLLSDETVRSEAQLARDAILQQAARIQAARSFITHWQVAGPFDPGDAPGTTLFEAQLPPETNQGSWRILPVNGAEATPWMFRLHLSVRDGPNQVCYVRTAIHSDHSPAALLDFGDDDGSKIWFNGTLVYADETGGAATPGEHQVPVTLNPGWNLLLMKITQISGPWQFCLRLTDPQGHPLENLQIDPGQWPAEAALLPP